MTLSLDDMVRERNAADAAYQEARRHAEKIATSEFNRVFDETNDPFVAMTAYNTVMENLTGRK